MSAGVAVLRLSYICNDPLLDAKSMETCHGLSENRKRLKLLFFIWLYIETLGTC